MANFESSLLDYPVPGILIFVAAAVLSALACFWLIRRLLLPHAGIDSMQMSTSIITRLGSHRASGYPVNLHLSLSSSISGI